ncbi:hypothetical protein K440DRAFT_575643 [Wilcoxina mikolae CBS 423.85]|nr:hypothetical protein K440DRAFT_575643 [Wilcoxina mikolae CBS 423.85]
MGKLARFACILTPMICTLVSLCAVIVLLISGTKQTLLPSLYYVQLDVRDIQVSHNSGRNRERSADELGIKDFYSSYMWNFCAGHVDNSKNIWTIDGCTNPKAGYAFDVEEIVQTDARRPVSFPTEVHKVQKAINAVSKFMAACYVLGAAATIVTFFVGWFGLLSRWGSCVTTIFADVAFGFLLTASLCSTILAYSLAGAYSKTVNLFGVRATVGKHFISTTWFCTAFAFAAAIFWMMSMCCCSGRTKNVMDNKGKAKGTKVERTGGGYERVASPYQGTTTPLSYGAKPVPGYEPMRHV